MVVYDLETLNTDNAVPYAFGLFKLSEVSGKNYLDISQRDCEKCRNDSICFKGSICNNNMLDQIFDFK